MTVSIIIIILTVSYSIIIICTYSAILPLLVLLILIYKNPVNRVTTWKCTMHVQNNNVFSHIIYCILFFVHPNKKCLLSVAITKAKMSCL